MHRVKLTGRYFGLYDVCRATGISKHKKFDLRVYTFRSFDINCTTINTKIVSQIKKWTSDDCEDGGEKCLYTVCY